MDTNKAAYWIALGVLALGLTSEYREGEFVALHKAAGRAGSVLCRISTRAERTWAFASLLNRRESFSPDNLLAARDRAEMASDRAELRRETFRDKVRAQVRDETQARADVVRALAEMRRAEVEQIRWRAESQVQLARATGGGMAVVCPRAGTKIVVTGETNVMDLNEVSPEIKVDSF